MTKQDKLNLLRGMDGLVTLALREPDKVRLDLIRYATNRLGEITGVYPYEGVD